MREQDRSAEDLVDTIAVALARDMARRDHEADLARQLSKSSGISFAAIAPLYVACGKQVLRDDHHFADMACPAHAEALVILLNKGVLLTSDATAVEAETVRGVLWK